MIQLAALAAGGCAAAGIVVAILWWRGVSPHQGSRRTLTQRWARATHRPPGEAGRRRDLLWVLALVGGFVAYLLTGWLIAIAAVPAVAILAPRLLGQHSTTDIELLQALDRWVRQLATILPVGSSDVTGAIRISRATAPELIREEVSTLVTRIDAGARPEDALYAFADDLDSAETDPVAASLILSTTHTEGISKNLESIADSIQARLAALRTIEVERAKPRNTSRMVTLLSLGMITVAAIFGRGYFAPYATWYGQLILVALALAYVASTWWMYRITVPRRRARILSRPEEA